MTRKRRHPLGQRLAAAELGSLRALATDAVLSTVTRGAVVRVVVPPDRGNPNALYSHDGKVRTCVVREVLSDGRLVVLPASAQLHGRGPLLQPTPDNGFKQPSEVRVTEARTVPAADVAAHVGQLTERELRALLAWRRRRAGPPESR